MIWAQENPAGMTGGRFRVSDLLGHGQAVPLRYLVEITGWSGRDVRRRIEKERRQGIPILSDNASGYYLPLDETEIEVCVKSLRRRAAEIMLTASAIEMAGGGLLG